MIFIFVFILFPLVYSADVEEIAPPPDPNCKVPPPVTCSSLICACGYTCIMVNNPGCNTALCKKRPMCFPDDEISCNDISCLNGKVCIMVFGKLVNGCYAWPKIKCVSKILIPLPIEIDKIEPPVVGPGPIKDPAAPGGK